jgi:NADH:ubiquinone oxidoreductase subunit 4 (subunit M)
MGIVAVGLFSLHLAGKSGSMALLAAQMVTTGGLFLVSGMLHDRRGSFELDAFGGLARSAPTLASVAPRAVRLASACPASPTSPASSSRCSAPTRPPRWPP